MSATIEPTTITLTHVSELPATIAEPLLPEMPISKLFTEAARRYASEFVYDQGPVQSGGGFRDSQNFCVVGRLMYYDFVLHPRRPLHGLGTSIQYHKAPSLAGAVNFLALVGVVQWGAERLGAADTIEHLMELNDSGQLDPVRDLA